MHLTILSYHKFTVEESEYPFSRTYKQFSNDLQTKVFDWITIDDGRSCVIKACEMMREKNIRAKLFICTSLVGLPGYCSWNELLKLSKYHDIENHSHEHIRLTEQPPETIYTNIDTANKLIKEHIGIQPRYFVPPWNQFNNVVEGISMQLGLALLKDRIDIKNLTV